MLHRGGSPYCPNTRSHGLEGGAVGSVDDGRILPLRLLLVILAGWVNRYQQHVIEYLVEENRVLREQLRGACPIDRRPAPPPRGEGAASRSPGAEAVTNIVTPDTYPALVSAAAWTT
jgi:hypothetical protein